MPNVNVMDDLEARITRLSDDDKRLFALICRSYLAAVMPDFAASSSTGPLHVDVGEFAVQALPKERGLIARLVLAQIPWGSGGTPPTIMR